MPSASYLHCATYFNLGTVHSIVDTDVTVTFIFERNIFNVQISTINEMTLQLLGETSFCLGILTVVDTLRELTKIS